MIHPTAVIDPAAQIGADARSGLRLHRGPGDIGPGCVIEAHATLIGRRAARRGEPHRARRGHRRLAAGFRLRPGDGQRRGDRRRQHDPRALHDPPRDRSGEGHARGRALFADGRRAPRAQCARGEPTSSLPTTCCSAARGDRRPRVHGGGSVFHQFVRVGRGAMIQGGSAFQQGRAAVRAGGVA